MICSELVTLARLSTFSYYLWNFSPFKNLRRLYWQLLGINQGEIFLECIMSLISGKQSLLSKTALPA